MAAVSHACMVATECSDGRLHDGHGCSLNSRFRGMLLSSMGLSTEAPKLHSRDAPCFFNAQSPASIRLVMPGGTHETIR